MKVHNSALKHGVVAEDASLAADWPLWVEPLDEEEWPHRELRPGFDTQPRLLETVVLTFESATPPLTLGLISTSGSAVGMLQWGVEAQSQAGPG